MSLLAGPFSKVGSRLCLAYALLSAAFVAYGALAVSDSKGRFVFLQLPIVLQAAILDGLGLSPLLSGLSWPAAYLIIGLPTLALLYSFGALVDRALVKQQ
jgi:hypothetical protein